MSINNSSAPTTCETNQLLDTLVVDHPWLERRVLRYAHQGGAKEAPSSTMFAFRQAIANGADALEMDVHRTADGHLVVCHDESIDRTTQLSGRIDDLTLAELREADNAYWWAPGHQAVVGLTASDYPLRDRAVQDPSLRVALLTEVLEEFPDTILNFDIKGGKNPYEDQLADCLLAYERTNDVIVASFHDDRLVRFRAAAPSIHTSAAMQESWTIGGALQHGHSPSIPAGIVALQIPFRFEHNGPPLFDANFVEAAHQHGLAVHVWTIDEPEEMQLLLTLGVDGIISDRPSVLTSVCEKFGASRATRVGE
jgi:glycerophosphoryl diester phosphodiesterase